MIFVAIIFFYQILDNSPSLHNSSKLSTGIVRKSTSSLRKQIVTPSTSSAVKDTPKQSSSLTDDLLNFKE